MRKIFCVFCVFVLIAPEMTMAAAAKKQSAIQNGTTVRNKVNAKNLYSQDCYDEYYGCMDQFCISDNGNGGSCMCSNDNAKYEKELQEIEQMLAKAEQLSTTEVEKIKLDAQADIVFNGERKYDEKGNVIKVDAGNAADKKKSKRADLMKMFENNFDEEDEEDDNDNIANKKGAALFTAADEICTDQIDGSCSKDMKILRQLYQRQIDSDCRGFANSVKKQRADAQNAVASAESDVRNALKESFDSANKYNQGECMVEFKNCMLGADACGSDWTNCVSIIASENMQNKKATSTAKTKVKTVVAYDITPSVLERLESKRTICERVLDQCMVVRDNVWTAFLREVAPTLKLAESRAESNFRQSCLTDISQCIQKACKDDIAGKGKATMDACLSRPDMARSFCKVEIDPCERMEPLIWGYVTDKLAAMRVDACTQEVKDCFTDESRCGADFSNCIGMDYDFIHDLCPIDKLVVCKKNNPKFKMADIDSMIMGLYLNIDNSALENCQKLVEDKMMEICGSTSDCNRFAADDTMGTGSLRSQKDKNIYRITGMISFGSIKMGDVAGSVKDGKKKLGVGELGVAEYMDNATKASMGVKNAEGILDAVRGELNNIAGTVNRVVDMIALDPKIQFCISGRDTSQITGKEGKTTARFPHLLDQVKTQISIAALRKAQDNYNAKLNEYIAKATKDASADVAQYMCQMLPVTGGAPVGGTSKETTALTPPYAISYEVASGISNKLLSQGGRGKSATGTGGVSEFGDASARKDSASRFGASILSLGGSEMILGGIDALKQAAHSKINLPNGTREMWSLFNRDTRVCHYCTSTVTKSCSTKQSSGFFGIGSKSETSCEESDPVEKCEDIEM